MKFVELLAYDHKVDSRRGKGDVAQLYFVVEQFADVDAAFELLQCQQRVGV